ncbi:nitroreductase family protein [candidate division KSB1 bacterium]|nr:nitroreductase family protein [candidate division KSB1 bacterium]
MFKDESLYNAILSRRSIRRYRKQALDADTMEKIRDLAANSLPLVSDNRFEAIIRDTTDGENLASVVGGYGRIVSPPHYLVPFVTGETHLLEELGFRLEQLAVRMTSMGIGSCYVGCIFREQHVKSMFGLPRSARCGSLLAFGLPPDSIGGKTFNSVTRFVIRATDKLPAERILFSESFEQPDLPPENLKPLIEAVRLAPSAVNAQPWRFIWKDGRLHLFIKRRTAQYGSGVKQDYKYIDAGICMANISLAMEAGGIKASWRFHETSDSPAPKCLQELQPVAWIDLQELST